MGWIKPENHLTLYTVPLMCYALQKHKERQLLPGKWKCEYFSIHFGMDLYVPVLNSTLLHLPPIRLHALCRRMLNWTQDCCDFCRPSKKREYWMLYRGPGFLAVVWFGSSPFTVIAWPATHIDWERDKLCWREGWGRSQIMRPQKKAWTSINHSILSGSNNLARSHPTNIHNLVLIRNGNVIRNIWGWCNDTTTSRGGAPPPPPPPQRGRGVREK